MPLNLFALDSARIVSLVSCSRDMCEGAGSGIVQSLRKGLLGSLAAWQCRTCFIAGLTVDGMGRVDFLAAVA